MTFQFTLQHLTLDDIKSQIKVIDEFLSWLYLINQAW